MGGIDIANGERGVVLTCGLTDHENRYAVLCQRIEYPGIDTYHAHHSQADHSNQARIVDRRDSFDGFLLRIIALIAD